MFQIKIKSMLSMSKLFNIFKLPTGMCWNSDMYLQKPSIKQSSVSGMFSQDKHCSYCNGNKILRCMECNGCGKIYYDGIKENICDMCDGYGCIQCNFCGGTGKNCIV
jgi:hypothetical protein